MGIAVFDCSPLWDYKGAFTADETIHAVTHRGDNEAIQRPWDAGMGYNDGNDNNTRIMTIPLSVDWLYSVKERLFLIAIKERRNLPQAKNHTRERFRSIKNEGFLERRESKTGASLLWKNNKNKSNGVREGLERRTSVKKKRRRRKE